MKAKYLLILPALFFAVGAPAQTNTAPAPASVPPPPSPDVVTTPDNPPYVPPPATPKPHVAEVPQPDQASEPTAPPPEDNVDPAKVTEFQKRFADGNALEKQGKLSEALAVYQGILTEQPNAKGSLLHAGEICLELGDVNKADGYLEKLHTLVPDFADAIELLIQINQSLKRDVKVELLLQKFRELYDAHKINQSNFVREVIHSGTQDIVITQFFDYTQTPNTVWMAEVHDANDNLMRRILLTYDDGATRALRAKDAKFAQTQVFTWCEPVFANGQPTRIDAYLQIFALPDYEKYRNALLIILTNPPKPIFSAPAQ